jgi:hypothetical protein
LGTGDQPLRRRVHSSHRSLGDATWPGSRQEYPMMAIDCEFWSHIPLTALASPWFDVAEPLRITMRECSEESFIVSACARLHFA